MQITGEFFIAGRASAGRDTYQARAAATGADVEPTFFVSRASDVDAACRLAAADFDAFRETSLAQRAQFLETIAEHIAELGDVLIERAMLETGLPRQRLEGETQRTINQLRLFAAVVRQGDWLTLRLDGGLPDRTPPRPDLRLRKVPLGPVAVFGASNFPLAFSVAGGDTAAALAAGCPVVVKSHPAHPGVSELVARAIVAAVSQCGLPGGVFSLVAGPGHDVGQSLVAHPSIQAVGFTGSRAGGLALSAVAAARPQPIPVFAEMSSVNPVFLLPAALHEDAEQIARGFVASLTLGAGQFCTNPGLVFGIAGAALERFTAAAAGALASTAAQTMLTPLIREAYENGVALRAATDGVRLCGRGREHDAPNQGRAALLATDAQTFRANPHLAHEVFGPAAILVAAADGDELLNCVSLLEGQLTAAIHLRAADNELARRLAPALERKAGRLIANGWPTGVEVTHAMVHGGPFPATSDSRATSVGSLAIERFLRPVCYQDFPATLLPQTLRDDSRGIARLVDGVRVAAQP